MHWIIPVSLHCSGFPRSRSFCRTSSTGRSSTSPSTLTRLWPTVPPSRYSTKIYYLESEICSSLISIKELKYFNPINCFIFRLCSISVTSYKLSCFFLRIFIRSHDKTTKKNNFDQTTIYLSLFPRPP